MKYICSTIFMLTTFVNASFGALNEGDIAPDFKTEASVAGKAFSYSLKESIKKGPVVVYFYPAVYTGGCNIQAHTFAINYEKFAAAGATVVGVSLDNIARLNEFSADPEYCAGKVAVASDVDGKIAKSYDLKIRDVVPGKKDTRGADLNHGFAERTTFVVNKDGRIAATVGGVAPDVNVEKALEVVQQLSSK
ncbi:peroxiredoxin [Ampullimonas aquatilis]|uniref:peroxiredoxin n=1 Tax=Ampullimonas aquatilis TaxID=1341549 RepID=UPI003C72FB4F